MENNNYYKSHHHHIIPISLSDVYITVTSDMMEDKNQDILEPPEIFSPVFSSLESRRESNRLHSHI